MYFFYSFLITLAFIILLPHFLFDYLQKGKYSEGFWQRLGYLPEVRKDGNPVLWVHCVSVGETNAALPIVNKILQDYPNYRLVVSTTTKTGQALAKKLFGEAADLVFYFPFDWKFSVRRALKKVKPNIVLLMESELWFNFVRQADISGASVFIVNGRFSEKSFRRFSRVKKFIRRLLRHITLALMQDQADADRLKSLGLRSTKARLTGNVKFDQKIDGVNEELTNDLRSRFKISPNTPLIVAVSTHSPEEELILVAFKKIFAGVNGATLRLLIAPRHPERFEKVADLIRNSGFELSRRSNQPADSDQNARVILLDSIGELRSVLPLAEIVFVGGSLIPHGGQNILEAAAVEKAIVTGHYTINFDAILKEFRKHDAVVQLPKLEHEQVSDKLAQVFSQLLQHPYERTRLAKQALFVMTKNRGATEKTVEYLKPFLSVQGGVVRQKSAS